MESVESQKRRILDLLNAKFRKVPSTDDDLEDHLKTRLQHGSFQEAPMFRHRRLSNPSRIRLLVIFPGTSHQEIQCSLQEVDLEALDVKFVALSYVWGAEDFLLPINCNNAIALIGANLYSAMVRVRYSDQLLPIWIDALCIDQGKDTAALLERASQVRLMAKIYSSAKCVLADLGGCSRDESSKLKAALQQAATKPLPNLADLIRDVQWEQRPEYAMDEPTRTLLIRLFHRPWFRRVWVVQEFVLAKEVVLSIGGSVVSSLHALLLLGDGTWASGVTFTNRMFDDWRYASHYDATSRQNSFSEMVRMRMQLSAEHGHHQARSRKMIDLATLLDFARFREAKDVRDHIYAIMGLMTALDLSNFAINYSEDASALALRFAQTLAIQGHGGLCLSRASGINLETPSWVPPLHLDARSQVTGLHTGLSMLMFEMGGERAYNACGPTRLDLRIGTDANMIAAQAIQVDTIETFTLPNLRAGRDVASKLRQHNIYPYLRAWALDAFKGWSEAHFWNSFYRTITADYDYMAEARASPDVASDFWNYDRSKDSGVFVGSTLALPQISQEQSASASRLDIMFSSSVIGKKLCRTRHNRMALIPAKSVHENEIWIILGFPVPLVLRRLGDYHVIVGQCYLHGMMDGEVMKLSDRKVETVNLR